MAGASIAFLVGMLACAAALYSLPRSAWPPGFDPVPGASSRRQAEAEAAAEQQQAMSRPQPQPHSHYYNYRPTTCSPQAPCYDATFSLLIDGLFQLDLTPGVMTDTYQFFGKDLAGFQERALEYYSTKYGLTFSTANSMNLADVNNMIPSDDGGVMLLPYVIDYKAARSRFHVVTAKDRSQFGNYPVQIAGFLGIVMQDRDPSMGSRNISVPSGAQIVYSSFFFEQCPQGRDWRLCRYSILTPNNPRQNIDVEFYSQYYSLSNQEPSRFSYADCNAYSELFGDGAIHGYNPLKEGSDNIIEARQIVTFPANAPQADGSD